MARKAKAPLVSPGGKGHMVKKLLQLLPPHKIYVEVFGGAAHLLFAKEPAPVEVYNDIDSSLVNFFRVLRDPQKSAELIRLLELTPYSREEHQYAKAALADGNLSDVERAYFFFIANRQGFAGELHSPWGYAVRATARGMAQTVARWQSAIESLPEYTRRLLTVQIEHDDFRKVIPRYDTPETFFYCDPPYVPDTRRTKALYAHEMTLEHHEDLVQLLLNCQGMVMLSGYHHPVYEPLEKAGWRRYDLPTACSLVGRTRLTGVLGDGSLKEKQPRVESVWLNPQAEEARQRAKQMVSVLEGSDGQA